MGFSSLVLQLLLVLSLFHISLAGRTLSELVQDSPSSLLKYHKGSLLSGKISVNLIWYGKFKPSQRAIVSDFIQSLYTQTHSPQQPSVSSWWKTTEKYYHLISNKHPSLNLTMGKQILDESYSFGKSLTNQQIIKLAAKGDQVNAINVVLTASDVAVDGFCSSRCGTHGSAAAQNSPKMKNKSYKFAYIWVGNSETQCPGQCAWPFHQPIYGPQSPPLIAPNNDVGLDGMVINIASLLAGTATNPFGNGYYQGPAEAPLEAASACPGVYGKGAYPGYAGELRVDSTTGASYNANGANGRKYLLPALFDPSTSSCSTLSATEEDDGLVSDSGDESDHLPEEESAPVIVQDPYKYADFIASKVAEINKVLGWNEDNIKKSVPSTTKKERRIGARSTRRKKRAALLLEAEATS